MRSIYIAATGQHAGKTTMALGLIPALQSRGYRCVYSKPVGQRFIDHDGHRADEDAWLCREVFGIDVDAETMSPVTIPRGYVAEYLANPHPEHLQKKIMDAAAHLRERSDLMVIEGTGHAGVGSCLDLSNARVAKMLDAAAVMVVPGGVGRCLDEVALSQALFNAEGVELAGVVANKVYPDKYDKIGKSLEIGFKRLGTRLLGAIPFEEDLTFPTVRQIRDELDARLLCGEGALARIAKRTLIAAMTPQHMLRYLHEGSLVITPGDRIDNILVAISTHMTEKEDPVNIAGIVLTGGFVPHPNIMPMLRHTGLPVLLCEEDTYTVSSKIFQQVFKIVPGDTEKVVAARRFVQKHVDIDTLLEIVNE